MPNLEQKLRLFLLRIRSLWDSTIQPSYERRSQEDKSQSPFYFYILYFEETETLIFSWYLKKDVGGLHKL